MIADCGEILEGEDDGYTVQDDGTGDMYASYPQDADFDLKEVNNFVINLLLCRELCVQNLY